MVRHRRGARSVVLVLVAAILAAAGVAKLVSGHSANFAIGPRLYFAAAAVEVAMALALLVLPRVRSAILFAAAVTCATGSVVTYWFTAKPCGCFGSVVILDNATHCVVNALLGLTCLWLASHGGTRESSDVGEDTASPVVRQPS